MRRRVAVNQIDDQPVGALQGKRSISAVRWGRDDADFDPSGQLLRLNAAEGAMGSGNFPESFTEDRLRDDNNQSAIIPLLNGPFCRP